MNNPEHKQAPFDQAILGLVLAYQVLAAVILLVTIFLIGGFVTTPFTGALYNYNLVVDGATPQGVTPGWSLASQGVGFGYQVLAVNDQSVKNPMQLQSVLQGHFPGETIPILMRTPQGGQQVFQVQLSVFSMDAQLVYFILPFLLGVVFLASGLWILNMRRNEPAGRAFALFTASAAIATGGYLDIVTTGVFAYIWSAAIPLLGGALIHLSMVFPQELRMVRKNRHLQWLGYIVALSIILSAWLSMGDRQNPLSYAAGWRNGFVLAGVGGLVFLAAVAQRRIFSDSGMIRRQSNVILLGALGFVPLAVWFIFNLFGQQPFTPLLMAPVVVFPVLTGYAVTRYRMLRADYVISRGTLYALLSLMGMAGFIILAIGFNLVFGQVFALDSPVLIAMMVFYSIFLLLPVRQRLQELIDTVFFRGQRAYQRRLQEFARAVTTINSTSGITTALRENIMAALAPVRLHIYTLDSANDQYVASIDENSRPSSDVRFGVGSALARLLGKEDAPLFIDNAQMPAELESERTRIALLGASLFIPLPGPRRLIGWLAMGERLSGETYTDQDLEFLDSFADQATVALARSQTINTMERRVQELNALARIAQGINVTLNFDDVLELIYAQSMQIIPGTDFHLALAHKTGGYAYYAFCIEDNDRLDALENKPIASKTTLEQEVIAARRPIITQDYQRECQFHGVVSPRHGLGAWVGVPLNSGSDTIGALSVGSNNPGAIYTPAQMELLQAIADQAAGAIVKSRLLQETERRAQQLSTLNVIARQLASTLDPEPLLQNILDSAVGILDCEAGSLFLVDAQTDELVFRVTVGPVASNLVGQRLPPGTGVVGRVVANRHAIIVNETQNSAQWNSSPDRQTGFQTRALLAVPMAVKERIIGVIEIINKRGGLPFTAEDETLLTAFAGQAAVAIENARLYTLTDQELNARVEELSVMQRIDRELNASLDVNRAMRTTFEWAMRQSKANAGFIGVAHENGLQMIAEHGLTESFKNFPDNLIPAAHPALREVLENGQPLRRAMDDSASERAFLSGARTQLVVPIRREAQVIGLFLLESLSADALQTEAQDFLSRLSDHAAIALSNAQLYAQVQNANNAKSQFVSFVAHELKNPMASIKGYTELVIGGMAGPVNENQVKFLSTVRSNVDRMNTIVSDLSDLSKIEAGKLKLDFKSVDVADIVEDVIRSTKHQIDDKQQVVQLEMDAQLPKIWADRNRMIQIMVNLASNAHKYTPAQGRITIGAQKTDNHWDQNGPTEVVHLWVRDTGIGIGPEDQKNIFQQYFRTEHSKEMATGTGLGLNITKSLVEMQGGKIWFESEKGKGTAFHFTVPISEN